jgi:hypothetical protein
MRQHASPGSGASILTRGKLELQTVDGLEPLRRLEGPRFEYSGESSQTLAAFGEVDDDHSIEGIP